MMRWEPRHAFGTRSLTQQQLIIGSVALRLGQHCASVKHFSDCRFVLQSQILLDKVFDHPGGRDSQSVFQEAWFWCSIVLCKCQGAAIRAGEGRVCDAKGCLFKWSEAR